MSKLRMLFYPKCKGCKKHQKHLYSQFDGYYCNPCIVKRVMAK